LCWSTEPCATDPVPPRSKERQTRAVDVPSESLSLNFTSITMIAHIAGSAPQTVTYNLL
jgi:hypothetical protein